MKKLTLIFIALFTSVAFAQDFEWAKNIGDLSDDRAYSVDYDAFGNVYVAGAFSGIVDFNPVGGGTLHSTGGFDVYVVKFDSLGNFIWAESKGAQFDDYIYSMVADDSGYVYITGSGAYNSSGANTELFIAKLDPSGNTLWEHHILGDQKGERGYSIQVDDNGNVYTGGIFSGTVDFDPDSTAVFDLNVPGPSVGDAFLLKLDGNGDFVWAKALVADGGNANCNGIDLDAMGNIYTTGSFSGSSDFNPDGANTHIISSNGGEDIFVSKLDAQGNFVWAKTWGSSASPERGQSIHVDASGNVFSTGFYASTVDFDPGSGTYNLSSNGNRDIYISQLDPLGQFVWAKSIGGTEHDYSRGITLDASQNIYLTGHFKDTVDFDPGTGTHTLSSFGGYDICILKLNNMGDFDWAYNMGSNNDDYGNGIAVDASDNVYLAGYFSSVIDCDPSTGTHNLSSNGSSDIYITKWSQTPQINTEKIINLSQLISVYPNPATSTLTIDSKDLTIKNILVKNITGKTVKSISSTTNNIDVSDLTNGLYILQIQTESGIFNTKFIKN